MGLTLNYKTIDIQNRGRRDEPGMLNQVPSHPFQVRAAFFLGSDRGFTEIVRDEEAENLDFFMHRG